MPSVKSPQTQQQQQQQEEEEKEEDTYLALRFIIGAGHSRASVLCF